jgi:hypothetical protein
MLQLTKYNTATISLNNCNCGPTSIVQERCCKPLIVIIANDLSKALQLQAPVGSKKLQTKYTCHIATMNIKYSNYIMSHQPIW